MSVDSKSDSLSQSPWKVNLKPTVEHLPIVAQARALSLFLFTLYVLPVVVLAAVVITHERTGVSFDNFMRDPARLVGAHPFLGFVSNLGVLFWCASAAVCLFSWSVLRNRLSTARFAAFVFYAGLLTTLLLADDFFELHEIVFPLYFRVPEKVTYACYGILVACLLVAFRNCVVKTEYLILLQSLGFFGLSMVSDAFQPLMDHLLGQWRILAEDGLKFFGIVGWFGYYSRSCFIAIKNGFAEQVPAISDQHR